MGNKIKFSQINDPEKWGLDGIYMIDGKKVSAMEHNIKGLEIGFTHGSALVKEYWNDDESLIVRDLITNPDKKEMNNGKR